MQAIKKINIRELLQRIDWKLFFFLLLFLNVKMILKVVALLIIYLFRPNFRFGFSFKKNSKLPLFYVLMIGIAILNWILTGGFLNTNYNIAMLTGIGFWVLCILAVHQIKGMVETTSVQIVHNTLLLFFIVNALFSFLDLARIVLETGAVNPYTYQGLHQKYFIGTGDAIKGITFDSSGTNALINTFGVIYSLKKSKFYVTLLCMSVLLLTASNFTNILLLAAFLFLFIFQSDRNQKSILFVCSFMLLIFLTKISPQNGTYVTGFLRGKLAIVKTSSKPVKDKTPLLEKPDSLLGADEKKQKTAMLYLDSLYKARTLIEKKEVAQVNLPVDAPFIKPSIPKPNIHTEPFQKNKDTTELQKRLLEFAETKINEFDTSLRKVKRRKEPGKLVAIKQTINFFEQHPLKIFTGAGMGNFSSKLAFRTSGLGMAGGYSSKYVYINDDFKNNHLKLYLDYFSKEMELHSLTNTPNSVYDQLLAEYGLAGVFSFIFFYIGYFFKKINRRSYAAPLLLIFLGALAAEYWFEQLSVIIVFELLLFLNTKETKEVSAT